jgi:hypothetical protein
MFARKFFFSACLVLFVTLALERSCTVHARYLPTRSNGDRVDKLRELLRDVSLCISCDDISIVSFLSDAGKGTG